MARVLLGLSNEYAYFKGEPPAPVKDLPHDPWFWCIPEKSEDPEAARRRVIQAWESKNGDLAASGSDDLHPLQKIKAVGPLKEVQSFVHFGQRRKAFPVFAKRSYYVPDISDELFARHGVFTAEHDVPYQERAMIDLAAGVFENADGRKPGQFWPFDTHGEKVKLKVLVYDIETTQWDATAKKQVPVDMLGWAEFEIGYRASIDLDKEEFNFEITDPAPDWKDVEVFQDEAANLESEIRLLTQFVRRVPGYDIVSGHNILGFDNKQVYERIQNLMDDRSTGPSLGPNEKRAFDQFARVWASKDRTFTFGNQQDIVSFHPTSLDTLNAARRFYFFLDDFGLKRLAPFMGVNVPDRVYLTPHELKVGDGATRLYNRHDVQEQVGVTTKLLAQALPLAFTAGWTFEELLTAGNVKMWDHMGMIRAARTRKLAMPTSRARGIARSIIDLVGKSPTREQVWTRARVLAGDRESAQKSKEFIRVAKYGDEMPEFVEVPGLVINPKAVDAQRAADQGEDVEEVEEEEYLGYSIPGGMTLHPQELGSHFVPWWHVVTADVGAMYPTILRARNVSADTIRLARKGEAPDTWVWFFRVSDEFLQDPRWVTRPATKEESYGQEKARGVMVGIKKNPAIGVTASAMKAVMSIAARVKKALGAAKKNPNFPKPELEQLQMMYASLKANRNAGTHGQMLAVGVSCRGFNMFAGAEITTLGQKILADVQGMLEERGARVIYGDTDGIYIGTSKSARNFPEVAEAMGEPYEPGATDSWYILPDEAEKAIALANDTIRKFLDYEAFELEAEDHDCMVFVVHKNYLIFDVKKGKLEMVTKGNNFRGSDKAPIAQTVLKEIMRRSLKDLAVWEDEAKAREALQAAIKKHTRDAIREFDASAVDIADLTLIQVVQPESSYKPNPDGSPSIWIKRARALEKLTGEKLRTSKKYRFLVCKKPLEGIDKPSKTGIKPLDYMWPVDSYKGKTEVDLDWYKDMIEKYVRGAFGFEDLELHTQKGLDAWM